MTGSRRRGEQGSVVVLFALIVLPMTMMCALVLDLANDRLIRQQHGSVADAAARAAASNLPSGPWPGVCRASDYILANERFSAFDAGSIVWSNVGPSSVYAANPCAAPTSAPYTTPCSPSTGSTWAKMVATAMSGRVTVEIQSGYSLPDARFAEDALRTDAGDPARGSCDNVAVIITDRPNHAFGGVVGSPRGSTRIRAVARLNALVTVEYVAALQLLEQHKCGVLQTGGANTRVIVQPYNAHPGVIQIDSADDAASCPQPILNGQATSGGPSIVACSTQSTLADCVPGSGMRRSQVGLYALGSGRPAAEMSTSFPTTYGDTAAVATPRSGRQRADARYRRNIAALDADVKATLSGSLPPGCSSVTLGTCMGNVGSWVVLRQTDCNDLPTFFSTAGRTAAQRIWFDCDLLVSSPLTLTASASTVVVTGQLAVGSTFGVSDPRTVYVGGRSTGNKIGLDIGGGTSNFNINNLTNDSQCAGRTGPGHATTFVLGKGSMNMASGGRTHLCQTFTYLASAYDKVPTTDGTAPCTTSACSNYQGTISVSSGAEVDWSAPNAVVGRQPTDTELATTDQFEDLALWTEAGGNTNGLTGGASTSLSGIFFLPNADSFNLAGNGSLPIRLSAQFIATSLKATGGATFSLVPNPEDSIEIVVYSVLLTR